MTTPVGPPPPFDPEIVAALDAITGQLPNLVDPNDIARRRALRAELFVVSDDDLRRDGAFTLSQRTVPGPEGAPDISLVICLPTAATAAVPALYYVHGGGMIMGDARLGLPKLLDTARELGTAVVSVEYRLAPEHPHPAPVQDCYAGLLWTVEHAEELGIDPDRVVIVGASAGGGLAAATALLARDRGAPPLLGQWLMCPMLDDRNNSYSTRQLAGRGLWDQTANQLGWTALLGDARGGPDVSPYAAPARATDLSDLPPTFIDVGSAETFRDEAIDYANRIWQAGGSAELHVWPGGFHGFSGFAPQAGLSQAADVPGPRWLRRLLG